MSELGCALATRDGKLLGAEMNDREKLWKLLERANFKCHGTACDICDYRDEKGCFTHLVIDHLLASGVTVQRWIPVTERLPGNEKVLITDGEIVMRGYRRPDGVWKYGIELHEVWERLSLKRVTHWMPLPEPPKEGE